MATLKSQSNRLLVVCETDAPLPNLNEAHFHAPGQQRAITRARMHENVTIISQFFDEDASVFAERVLSRVTRDLRQGIVFRGVLLAMNHQVKECVTVSRRRLVHSLAAMLAQRPNGSLQLRAPLQASEAVRTQLLELTESTARGAPHVDVNVAFPVSSASKRRRIPSKDQALRLSA